MRKEPEEAVQIQTVLLLTWIDRRSTADVASHCLANVRARPAAGGVDEESQTVALTKITQPGIYTWIPIYVIWPPTTSGDLSRLEPPSNLGRTSHAISIQRGSC